MRARINEINFFFKEKHLISSILKLCLHPNNDAFCFKEISLVKSVLIAHLILSFILFRLIRFFAKATSSSSKMVNYLKKKKNN